MFDTVFQALFYVSAGGLPAGGVPLRRHDGHRWSAAALARCWSIGAAVFTYRRVRVNEGRLRDRVVLTSLRIAALALVLFCLFRPTLVVRAAVPQQNVVAVLLDDSRSMQIPRLRTASRAASSSASSSALPTAPS